MSGKKKDEETTEFFQVPEGLLRRARGDDSAPDTERQPGSTAATPPVPATSPPASVLPWALPANVDEGLTTPTERPKHPSPSASAPASTSPRTALRPLVDPPRLRRSSSRPDDPAPTSVPLPERPIEEDTLVTNRDEILRMAKE